MLDELLGLEPTKEQTAQKQRGVSRASKKIEQLPPADQRAVLKMVDALVQTPRRNAS